MTPFKFGTIVENDFFTDRIKELEEVKRKLDSENHLVLISPRRYGKSSLLNKALTQLDRPSITIDFMKVLSMEDLAAQILKAIFRIYKMEKIKHLMSHFRINPSISYNPTTDVWGVKFNTSVSDSVTELEDAMELLQKVTAPDNRLIVVLDEFQEVESIDKNLAKILRSIMQRQSGLNYVFMGSQESMMDEIFEKKKSPFYHFGQRMNLRKVPYDDFLKFIVERLPESAIDKSREEIASEILAFTDCHPYYTQQLSATVYTIMKYDKYTQDVVKDSIAEVVREHDLDYERLWQTFNRTDMKTLTILAEGENPQTDRSTAYSTASSALKRLQKQGHVIREKEYRIEDPFFGVWIRGKRNM